jgi:GTPase
MLQESKGALYEIGIADDGTFVGLEEDELEASLDVLRTMAKKIGASVTVTRKVPLKIVDERDVEQAEAKLAEHLLSKAWGKAKNSRGKYFDETPDLANIKVGLADAEKFHIPKLGTKLWVAEALVKPNDGTKEIPTARGLQQNSHSNSTEQLRISFTGPTTCGKSTLLGTLTTGDCDNGRGKSRLSLLRHRHELMSGVTSSVSWEIIGYKPGEFQAGDQMNRDRQSFKSLNDEDSQVREDRIVNYAAGNISSWMDIHSAAEGGRIVFISDSAGRLKYRRTTVRSLVGWAPHYAALLIPADDSESNDGKPGLSAASQVHIELCIKLQLPLVVLFTKMDIASKSGLREVFSGVLSTLKILGRKPVMVQNSAKVSDAVKAISAEPETAVPIIFTSAVNGDGVSLVHELLMTLPLPKLPRLDDVDAPMDTNFGGRTSNPVALCSNDAGRPSLLINSAEHRNVNGDPEMTTLFHVEEVYGFKPSAEGNTNSGGSVVSGHVRYGKVSIGDKLIVGPFNIDLDSVQSCRIATSTPAATPTAYVTPSSPFFGSRSHPPILFSRSPESGDESRGRRLQCRRIPMDGYEELEEAMWKLVRVVSVRRLRLPVASLFAGEAGTIGIVPVEDDAASLSEFTTTKNVVNLTVDKSEGNSDTHSNACLIDIGRLESLEGKKAVAVAPSPPSVPGPVELRLRKGLVIHNRSSKPGRDYWMKSYIGFTAEFDDDATAAQGLIIGNDVIVYIASVRAVARVVSVDPCQSKRPIGNKDRNDSVGGGGIFGFDFNDESESRSVMLDSNYCEIHHTQAKRRVGFEFSAGIEWIEMNAKVLVMKCQSHKGGTSEMEVFVGVVVQRHRDMNAVNS